MKNATIYIIALLILYSCNKLSTDDSQKIGEDDLINQTDTIITQEELVGPWIMIESSFNGVKSKEDERYTKLKFYTPTSFYWISYNKKTNLMRRSLAGSWTIEEKNYIENIQYVAAGRDMKFLDTKSYFKISYSDGKIKISQSQEAGAVYSEIWERYNE